MLIYRQELFVGIVLLFGGYHGQVAPLYPAQSDLTSGSLVAAAGSIGIVALAASAAIAVRAEQKKINCEQKLQTQEQSCDDLLEAKKEVEKTLKEAIGEHQRNKDEKMEVEKQLKEAIGEHQRNKDEMMEVEKQLKDAMGELQRNKDEMMEVEKQLKEAIGELQRNKDEMMACKTPGFFFHPVLGCIGIKANALRDARKWVDKCAEDGGELILINSAAEDQALANIFAQFPYSVVIQGKRKTLPGPWVTEDSQLLPYTGEFVDPTLSGKRIVFQSDGKWRIVNEVDGQNAALCEIRI